MTSNKSEKTALNYLADCVVGGEGARVVTTVSLLASIKHAVAAEAVSFAAGAAGTTGSVSIVYSPVCNATGALLGQFGDTSFAWVTGTVLTTEVAFNTTLTDAQQYALMTNGQWAMNYSTGQIRYKKATAGVGDTCNYTIRVAAYKAV
jgi:hypothetical protein